MLMRALGAVDTQPPDLKLHDALPAAARRLQLLGERLCHEYHRRQLRLGGLEDVRHRVLDRSGAQRERPR
ncbi:MULTISPECIES: hypothetical protein [Streptomyces]|uniref:hypothetical protein n=1 Tax=Streptomyces sp. RK75 TaxID=2824895 RepID=UPI0027DD1C7D|nr:hypothetical protein [Streptomyces sp. RK75]